MTGAAEAGTSRRMQLPLVFMDGPYRPTMGLRPLDEPDWLWLDERFAAETALRRQLSLERPGEVHALLPEARPAADEVLRLVTDWLPRHAPEHYGAEDAALLVRATGERAGADPAEPLLVAGLLVQEDLCLLGPGEDGYRLLGAHLCFPAHWRLHEKLGRPLREIHRPVPVFRDRLAGPVDRFFQGLDAARPVWRANWSIVEDPALFHPGPRRPDPALDAGNAGLRLWLRVERQTLRRLRETGFVPFTIRTLMRPLGEIARMPGVATALRARLGELPDDVAGYKGLPAMRAPLLAFLDAIADHGRLPAPQHAGPG